MQADGRPTERTTGINKMTDMVVLPNLEVEQYDPYTDTIVIEGTKYSGQLLRDTFGSMADIGQIFQIVKHDNGVVTVLRRYDLENNDNHWRKP